MTHPRTGVVYAVALLLAAALVTVRGYEEVRFRYEHPERTLLVSDLNNDGHNFRVQSTRVQQDQEVIFGGDCYHWTCKVSQNPFIEVRAFEDWQEPHLVPLGEEYWGMSIDEVFEFEYKYNSSMVQDPDRAGRPRGYSKQYDAVHRIVRFDTPGQWTPFVKKEPDSAGTLVVMFSSTYNKQGFDKDGRPVHDIFELQVSFARKAVAKGTFDVVVPNSARVVFIIHQWAYRDSKISNSHLGLKMVLTAKHGRSSDMISEVSYVPDRSADPIMKPHIRLGALPFEGFMSWNHDTYNVNKNGGEVSDGFEILHSTPVDATDIIPPPAFFGQHGPSKEIYYTVYGDVLPAHTSAQVVMYAGFLEEERRLPNTYRNDAFLPILLSVAAGVLVAGGLIYTCVVKGVFDHIKVKMPDGSRVNPERAKIRSAGQTKSYTTVNEQDMDEFDHIVPANPGEGQPSSVKSPRPKAAGKDKAGKKAAAKEKAAASNAEPDLENDDTFDDL